MFGACTNENKLGGFAYTNKEIEYIIFFETASERDGSGMTPKPSLCL